MAADDPPEGGQRFGGGSEAVPTWTNGDPAPAQLLRLALEWSHKWIGAELGGCALLSRRGEPIESAVGSCGVDAESAALADGIQRSAFSGAALRSIVERAEAADLSVLGGEPSEPPGGTGTLPPLADADLRPPLIVLLREDGRVAAALWMCLRGSDSPESAEARAAIRSVLPLLELALTRAPCPRAASPPAAEPLAGLTARERSVAELAAAGASNAAIAEQLGIAESTVKNHMSRVLAKLGLRTRSQLVALLSARAEPSP